MKKNRKSAGVGIHVGATTASVERAAATIMGILAVKADPTVLVAALDCLSTLCKVENTTIRDCTLTVK